jgi:hypothetical protein
VQQAQSALQPIKKPKSSKPPYRSTTFQKDNQRYELEEHLDAFLSGQPVPDSYDSDEEEYVAEQIQNLRTLHVGEENNPYAMRLRQMLATRRALNERHRRRQAEITRQATLEMQGSGVLAGMGFATYVR